VAFELYKSAQGRYVRVGTAIAAALVALVVSYYVWGLLSRHVPDDFAYKVYVVYAAPAVLFAVVAAMTAYYLNKPKAADFFIATESEMKKVSWSNKAELVGSTVVVIVTVLLLALFIYLADNAIIFTLARGLDLW
jgi:preprotein translocase subunit SecE